MPAANQFRPPAVLRINSTGVAQEDRGGGGDSTSSIVKSPFAASGTPAKFVLRWTKVGTFSQMSVAKTLRLAVVPPVGVTASAVPMVLPPANTRPRPSAQLPPRATQLTFRGSSA